MKKRDPKIDRINAREVVTLSDFEWWLEQRRTTINQVARGDFYGLSMEQVKYWYVCDSPVRWCRAFLDEPDPDLNIQHLLTPRADGSYVYNFFDYQIPSIEAWHQDAIHRDGAEVGKTREIIALTLWAMCTAVGFSQLQPSILIGAPQQTHLDEIIMAIEEVMGVAEGYRGQKPILHQFWAKPKKHPHYLMRFIVPNALNPRKPSIGRVYFRPSGHDGVAYRGVHVRTMAIKDEAAKEASEACWTEFYRAKKPGCITRIYSVPDGRRDTLYYKLAQKAVPGLKIGEKGVRLFHWSKKLMPPPFWDKDRERKYVDEYGGRDSPGYVRNVLGLDGDPSSTIWPTHMLMPNVRDVPEYRAIKLMAEPNTGTLYVEVTRVELEINNQGNKIPHEHWITERSLDLDYYIDKVDRESVRQAVRDLLREFIAPLDGVAELWAGADLGFSDDPTELLIVKRVGHELRDFLRLHLKGLEYALQCEIFYCLDEIFDWRVRWGADLGSAGVAVVNLLHSNESYAEGHYEERMIGFGFEDRVDAIGEAGFPVEKPNNKGEMVAVRMPYKQLATELLTSRYQNHAMVMAYDAEVIQHHLNHTAKERSTTSLLIYDKNNDHTIDARRTMILCKVFYEDCGADVFAGGTYSRGVG